MKKIFLFILLFFISINSSFALNQTQKTNIVKQADKIFLDFDKKLSKLDIKKQIEYLDTIIMKVSPVKIPRDKISEKNKIILDNLHTLLIAKRSYLKDNYKENLTIKPVLTEKQIYTQKLEKEYNDLKSKEQYILAKEKEDELIKLGVSISNKITDNQITTEKLKNEYYSYRENKQWDLMKEKENELAKYKIYFGDKGEILPLDDSKPLVYTERGSVGGVDTKAQQDYDQAQLDEILSNKINIQIASWDNTFYNINSFGGYNTFNGYQSYDKLIKKGLVKGINDEIITKEYYYGDEKYSKTLRGLGLGDLTGKTIYDIEIMTYNKAISYLKDGKLLSYKKNKFFFEKPEHFDIDYAYYLIKNPNDYNDFYFTRFLMPFGYRYNEKGEVYYDSNFNILGKDLKYIDFTKDTSLSYQDSINKNQIINIQIGDVSPYNLTPFLNLRPFRPNLIEGYYDILKDGVITGFNDGIITKEYYYGYEKYSKNLRSLGLGDLSGKTIYEVQVMSYNKAIKNYKDGELLKIKEQEIEMIEKYFYDVFSKPLTYKESFNETFKKFGYNYDSKGRVYYDSKGNIGGKDLKYIDSK